MGSSFTIVNNTPTVVYVSSDIAWGVVGTLVAIVGAALIALFVVLTMGLGAAAVSGAGKAAIYALAPIFKMSTDHLFAMGLVIWLGTGVVTVGGGGLTAIAGGVTVGIGAGLELDDKEMAEVAAKTREALKDYTKLMPGDAYKFSGTLSLVRDCTIVYDDGSVSRKHCWTGGLADSNNEYKVLDKMFTTNSFMGCWIDAQYGDHHVTHVGTDEVERTFTNRIMEKVQSGKFKKDGCMMACRGYEFFGLQAPNHWGDAECWCSNDMKLVDPQEMVKRTVKPEECQGNLDGNTWRMAVYKITPSKNYLNMYSWKNQQKIINNHRRRLALGDGSEADLGAMLGEDNLDAIEIVQDFHAYQGVESVFSSEELAMDHRRLPAHKQNRMFVEELEPTESRTRVNRLGLGLFASHDHDVTATRLASWIEDSAYTTFPDAETCTTPQMQECESCVQCLPCLEDQTHAMCKKQECRRCDQCAEFPLCAAVSEGCASETGVDSAMEGCTSLEECADLKEIMKCVSQKLW